MPHESRSRDACPHFRQFGTILSKVHTRTPGLWDEWALVLLTELGAVQQLQEGSGEARVGAAGGQAGSSI